MAAFGKEKHCVFNHNLVIINTVFWVFITFSDFIGIFDKMMAQTIGYLRVSTADQDLEKNKADILTLANHHNLGQVKFFEEKVSGKISWHKRKIAQVIDEHKKLLSQYESKAYLYGRQAEDFKAHCQRLVTSYENAVDANRKMAEMHRGMAQ